MREQAAAVYVTRLPGKMPSEERRPEHTVGIRLLARGLREQYGVLYSDDMMEILPGGKPVLADLPGIHFNISHSGEYVICILALVPVGIDIERHRNRLRDSLIRRVLDERELCEMEQQPDPIRYFFDRWVLREAYLKWNGQGITRDLHTLPFEGWSAPLAIDRDYSCAVWASGPLILTVKWMDIRDLYDAEGET